MNLEDIEHEIKIKKLELESLEKRRSDLIQTNEKSHKTLLRDMHLDPDKRNWEYDGYGNKVPKGTA